MLPLKTQRLVVIFLLIATLTGSGVFAVDAFRKSPASQPQNIEGPNGGAFVEQLPANTGDPDYQAAAAAGSSANLTSDIAGIIAQDIAASNPQGPVNRNGQPTIVVPNGATSSIDKYLGTIEAPSFNADSRVPELNLVDDNNESLSKYASDVSSITSDMMSQLQDSAQNPDEAFITGDVVLSKTSSRLAKVKVPKSAAGVHTALIELINVPASYSKIMSEDPFAGATMQDQFESALTKKMVALDAEISKLNSQLSESHPSFIAQLFGVETAFATVPTFDYGAFVQRIKSFVQYLKDNWEKIAVGYLKNRLLREVARQTMNWVLGKGEPQFVTNWQSFLSDSAQQGAGEVIESVAPSLCGGDWSIQAKLGVGNFADFLRRIMTPVDTYNYRSYTTCTIDKVVQNMDDFYADIRNGGWTGYSALLRPENTIFGSILTISDLQNKKAAEETAAAQAKAVAGNGYTGQELCDNGKPPEAVTGASGVPLFMCADKSTPHVVTPGTNTSDLVSRSFDSAYDRIAAANDWKPMLSFLIDAEVSRLTKAGVDGIFKYASKHDGGSGGGSGGSDAGGPRTADSTAIGQANQILQLKQQSIGYTRGAASAIQETINTLQAVVVSCTSNPAILAEAKAEIPPLVSLEDKLSLQISDLDTQITALQKFIQTNNFTLAQLTSKFGTFAAARKEADDLYKKQDSAETTYIGAQDLFSSCNSEEPIIPGGNSSSTTSSTLP